MIIGLAAFFTGIAVAVVTIVGGRLWKQRQARLEGERKARADQQKVEIDAAMEHLRGVVGELSSKLKKNSLEGRLKRAMEISTKQSRLNTRSSDDELHTYNNLELEKLDLLRGILRDGHDPVITVRLNSGSEQMSLSSYVATIQKTLN
jgi:hypothetical protein